MKKLTKDIFLERADILYNGKYDYSEVIYINSKVKIKIICPEHGEFEQIPNSHLHGHECRKCGTNKTSNKNKITTEEFLIRATEKFGDRYIYDKVIIDDFCNGKVAIECKVHGIFYQNPKNHTEGDGCSKCSGNYSPTTEEFIKECNIIYDGKYDYSEVIYVNCDTYINIICPEHGRFKQTPHNHRNYGCQECAGVKLSNTKEFIQKARELFGDKYDYSSVEYINAVKKVKIICPKHGEFLQIPRNHLSNHGCKMCRSSKGEIAIEKILKENNIIFKQQYSFGDLKYLIEYNGEQHYIYRGQFNSTKEQFLEGLERDKAKHNYCDSKTIPLYIIRYDENINEKLQEIINDQK